MSGAKPGVGGPRLRTLLAALAVLVVAVAYGVPLATTGDPLWPLPTVTAADRLDVYWGGARVAILPGDPRYRPLMDALDDAFTSPVGLELEYGLHAGDADALRASGRALEASYARETRAHGRYPLGAFTRVLVPFDGPEFERRLVFVGLESGYRSGPLRAPAAVDRLRALAADAAR